MNDADKKKEAAAKNAYEAAKKQGDTQAMKDAHAAAEAVRAQYGYSGGADGSQNISSQAGLGGGGVLKNNGGNSSSGGFDRKGYEKDSSKYVDKMIAAQEKARLEALRRAKESALSELRGQIEPTKQRYYSSRNDADYQAMRNKKGMDEMIAARGLASSGENITANLSLANARQKALNSLNRDEQTALNDINDRIGRVESDAVSQESQIASELQAQRMQALMSSRQQAETLGLQYDQFNEGVRQFDESQAFQKDQFDWNKGFQEGQFDFQKEQFEWEKDNKEVANALARTEMTGKVSQSDAEILGLPAGTTTLQAQNVWSQIRDRQIARQLQAAKAKSSSSGYTKDEIYQATVDKVASFFDNPISGASSAERAGAFLQDNKGELLNSIGQAKYAKLQNAVNSWKGSGGTMSAGDTLKKLVE